MQTERMDSLTIHVSIGQILHTRKRDISSMYQLYYVPTYKSSAAYSTYRIYSRRRSSYKPSQAFLGSIFTKKILYSNNLINSVRLFFQRSSFDNCTNIWSKCSFQKSQQNISCLLPCQGSIPEFFPRSQQSTTNSSEL